MDIFPAFFQVKVEIWQDIYFIHKDHITHLEHKRIFQRLVMSFRDRKNHSIFYSSCIKLRRTYKIPYIFKNHQIQTVCSQLVNSIFCHFRIQMAHSACVKLNHFCAAGCNRMSVYIWIYIRLHNAYFHVIFHHFYCIAKSSCFPCPRARHQVQKEHSLFF